MFTNRLTGKVKMHGKPAFVRLVILAFAATASAGGCSVQKIAVGATSGIIDNSFAALYEKSDLSFAERAIPGNLAMLDGLIKSDPGNRKLLLQAVIGYTGYALGFVEDDEPNRAVSLYATARDYGIALLSRNRSLKRGLEGSTADLEASLAAMRRRDVPALFWTANAWGSYIKMNPGDIESLADMGKVTALMRRVIELNEQFYYGSAHLFFGMIEAEKGIAGNPELAKKHFERALAISGRKFLLIQVMYARSYAVRKSDETLFTSLLTEVLDSPPGILPEVRLINEIARKKARLYLSMKQEWF